MKKILFTIQWYPSFRSANVLCDLNIIQALVSQKNFEIHCLVYRLKGQKSVEKIDGITIHRFDRSKLWQEIMSSYTNVNSLRFRFLQIVNRFLLRTRQILTIPLYPIYEPFLVRKFAKEAIRLHEQEHFDMVISEHNGIDTLFAGYYLKKRFPLIIYLPILWDPIYGSTGARYLPRKWREKRLISAERKILNVADRMICMHSNERNIINVEKNFLYKISFLDIPRLLPIKENNSSTQTTLHRYYKKGFINILYGGVMASRDISKFIDLCNRTCLVNLNLIFLVSTPTQTVESQLKKLNGSYLFSSYLPHEELVELLKQCEFVLNIGGGNASMVPSKIFEYMSYGKAIITTYIRDDDVTLRYLQNYPQYLALNVNSVEANDVYRLKEFISTRRPKVDIDSIRKFYVDCTPERYADLISSIITAKEG